MQTFRGETTLQKSADSYLLSAADLTGHLGCGRRTELDRAVADGAMSAPTPYDDPLRDALIERGRLHERAFVEAMRASGRAIVELSQVGLSSAANEETETAMKNGADIIVQAGLRQGAWSGRADILRRIAKPSGLGVYSYEVLDTKLARETTGATVLQLCLYADLLAPIQGERPEHVFAVVPFEGGFREERYRVDDYAAFYRRVRRQLEGAISLPATASYPEPVPACDTCRWFQTCDAQRRADDHLSFVANIAGSHRAELKDRGIETLAGFAKASLDWKPKRGAMDTLFKLQRQAAMQLEGRETGAPVHELIEYRPDLGLARLPEPSAGDIFLDFEGDPFVPNDGLEYLFGYACKDAEGALTYTGVWASNRIEEKAAFESFIDFVLARLESDPNLHIYHYGHYETSALKRLMGRYGTREDDLDALLRSQRFVDLLSVVRNGLVASVESYSIKRLEPFYQYTRKQDLPHANRSLARVQAALELDKSLVGLEADCKVVTRYNEDDCRSTLALRDWLEERRTELLTSGAMFDRPLPKTPEANENLTARMLAAEALAELLAGEVPVDPGERTEEQQAHWLMAQLLSWHRREMKAIWWEHFRLAAMSDEELADEKNGLAGLSFVGVIEAGDCPVHRYTFPEQETELHEEDTVRAQGGDEYGKVRAISAAERWIDIKKRGDTANRHASAIYEFNSVGTDVIADALMRIGGDIVSAGLGAGANMAARHLLLRRPPAPIAGRLYVEAEDASNAAVRVIGALPAGVLPIQGPPGAGKTFTGARMISALRAAGKRIGVTANSHKVINLLLREALKADPELRATQKTDDAVELAPGLTLVKTNPKTIAAIGATADVVGATAWFWARPDATNSVDVLFVDEAAQMSLANVLAVSQAAPTLVLLGDPRQLEQPSKGSHPDGADLSALDHILGGSATIGEDQGLFLAETWRLHPDICAFTSELFYEGRLNPRPDLINQQITNSPRLNGSGLRYLSVTHSGNQNVSIEEVEAVAKLVEETLASKATWTNGKCETKALTRDDILIVAPYNAQVFALQERLPDSPIGTVDKFQGQQAPIVIYAMTSSSSADAPRGMEFLYSLNRLNVATSRAKCVCVIAASPALFEAECRSPRQMELANALCRYKELAGEI